MILLIPPHLSTLSLHSSMYTSTWLVELKQIQNLRLGYGNLTIIQIQRVKVQVTAYRATRTKRIFIQFDKIRIYGTKQR